MTVPNRPRRPTGWNTYYPWLLALTATLAGLALAFIILSWVPMEPLPGIPPGPLDGPYLPGGLTILMGVIAGRQLQLRARRRSSRGTIALAASVADWGPDHQPPPETPPTSPDEDPHAAADQRARVSPLWKAAVIAGGSSVAVVAALLILGFSNGYSHVVVDQDSHPPVTYRVFEGTYTVVDSGDQLCSSGDDYYACAEMHRTMYNSVCAHQPLNVVGRATCENLRSFVTDVQARYASCGYGCETAGSGDWGWSFLHLEADYTDVTVPAQPQISHEERCDFDLGILTFGQCPGRPT